METTPAILLRRTRYSETSLIVTWLTLEHGMLKTLARGALRPKSSFSGVLDLFYEVEISFSRSAKSEIHALKEVLLLNPYEGIRLDYGRLELAAYFVTVLEQCVELEQPVPELFDLLCRALRYLVANPATLKALTHFEAELARLLGVEIEGSTPGAAATALVRLIHRLPESRRDLVKKLK
jgi:DNA repair protein RecO (recombination protein O)